MSPNITGYYQQLHFQCDELELFYNFPVLNTEHREETFEKCPHIDKLVCSRADELAPDKCISERECELYSLREELFKKEGIHAPTLKELDQNLRNSDN